MAQVQTKATLLLMLAAVLSATVLEGAVARPSFPGLFPPGLLPVDVQKCWSSVTRIDGCGWALLNGVVTGQLGKIGPACCRAVVALGDNCLPKMFPVLNPFFPVALISHCDPDNRH